jgi:hypothetical protein
MRSKQRGASFLTWILVAAMAIAVGLIAARVAPAYVDYYTIVNQIEALPKDRVHSMGNGEIRDALNKRLLINNIRDLTVDKIISIDRKRAGTTLILKYEVREPLVYNIFVVVAFDKHFEYG